MTSLGIIGIAALAGALGWLVRRIRRCQHRFGVPMRGTVCCMKCTRRFAIETLPNGTWRIARTPLPERLAGENTRPTPAS